jgi:hypothetical protein
MKILFSILCLGLAVLAFDASAQVTIEVTLDQQQFLPGESLPVTVHVTNRSGELLHLGDSGWLSFFIQSDSGSMVIRKAEPPVTGLFDLDNAEVATKRVDLAPYFKMDHTGSYRVTATLHISAWNSDISSSSQSFDVIEGAQLWSQSFGVADPGRPDQPPRIRKYTLVEANYLRDQLRLYVRVTDETDGSILSVHVLGPMISFGQPEAQLDHASKLHVLCQTGASAFTHSVISTDGKLLQQEIYDYVKARPRLSEDSDGNIIIQGGVRRVEPDTIPQVKSPDQLAR